MSWTDYTDYLTSHNVCTASAVLNGDTGGLVAGNNFSISKYEVELPTDDDAGTQFVNVNEAQLILEAFKKGKVTSSPAGLRMSGTKWIIVRADQEMGTLYLKKENGGACAAKTGKAIIIGTWSADQTIDIKNCPQNPGDTNKVVEALAKMLKAEGY